MMEFTFLTGDCICLPCPNLMKYWLLKLSVILDRRSAFLVETQLFEQGKSRRQQVVPGEKLPGGEQDKGKRLKG